MDNQNSMLVWGKKDFFALFKKAWENAVNTILLDRHLETYLDYPRIQGYPTNLKESALIEESTLA